MNSADTLRFVVLGNPIAHSKSPQIHRHFAQQTGVHIQYERLLVPLDGFVQAVMALQASGVSGANVTVPFKFEAANVATRQSEAVQFCSAANTLKFSSSGIEADNTDGEGLCRDLARLLAPRGLKLSDTQVLMVGAGGAASGCIRAFRDHGVQYLTLLNRTVSKAQQLAVNATSIGLPARAAGLEAEFDSAFDSKTPLIMVNASSGSLQGEALTIHSSWFEHTVLAYDMMYGPHQTIFMNQVREWCKSQSIGSAGEPIISDGLGMLVNQAAAAFEWWTGKRPDAFSTLNWMRGSLLGSGG